MNSTPTYVASYDGPSLDPQRSRRCSSRSSPRGSWAGIYSRSTALRGAFYTLVPIRPRWRGERRFLRTLPGASLLPPLVFNPRPRRLSTPPDAFQLHPDIIASQKNADGDVCVKIAWCGDSRAVIARDHDLARILDLTRDHKPEDESEQRRIESHYRRIAGDDSYGRSHAYSPSPEASTRAGTRGMPAVEVKIGHRDLFASFEANRE